MITLTGRTDQDLAVKNAQCGAHREDFHDAQDGEHQRKNGDGDDNDCGAKQPPQRA